jgi:hypothetical protein
MEQFQKAQDAVHRVVNLVAHIRQELRLAWLAVSAATIAFRAVRSAPGRASPVPRWRSPGGDVVPDDGHHPVEGPDQGFHLVALIFGQDLPGEYFANTPRPSRGATLGGV